MVPLMDKGRQLRALLMRAPDGTAGLSVFDKTEKALVELGTNKNGEPILNLADRSKKTLTRLPQKKKP